MPKRKKSATHSPSFVLSRSSRALFSPVRHWAKKQARACRRGCCPAVTYRVHPSVNCEPSFWFRELALRTLLKSRVKETNHGECEDKLFPKHLAYP